LQFEEVVKTRRTVRKFAHKPVTDRILAKIVEMALHAPSSMNGQPWRFVIVRNRDTLRKLVELKNHFCPPEKQEFRADFILESPVVIFTCVERARSYDRGIENGILATANILLAARNEGLSGVYMSAYRLDKPEVARSIRDLLGIPPDFDPITIVPLGYPGEDPPEKTIPFHQDVISHESF